MKRSSSNKEIIWRTLAEGARGRVLTQARFRIKTRRPGVAPSRGVEKSGRRELARRGREASRIAKKNGDFPLWSAFHRTIEGIQRTSPAPLDDIRVGNIIMRGGFAGNEKCGKGREGNRGKKRGKKKEANATQGNKRELVFWILLPLAKQTNVISSRKKKKEGGGK